MPVPSVSRLPAQYFRKVVSGERRGTLASALRCLLRIAEEPYRTAVDFRNRRYDLRPSLSIRMPVPVISVGNLTLGGTGKTPMVSWLARWFRDRQVDVTLVSRGYGSQDGRVNDEYRELHDRMPDVPHLQDPDRVAAARRAIQEFGPRLILLDDGFQHRRLARDLDIVLVDALEPFGFEHVFPRGTLREPLRNIARAQVIALTRADMINSPNRQAIMREYRRWARQTDWIELSHQPTFLRSLTGHREPIEGLAGRRVCGFCGIGNPTAFRRTLAACGCSVLAFRSFPDHHAYSDSDVASLTRWATEASADCLICTHKDLVKLAPLGPHGMPILAVEIDMAFLSGRESLEARLHEILEKTRRT
jgi:tetraacyldisaccharide 4'-kinase